jgi:dTDP-4-dehydrorhamnose reductase
LEKDIFLFDAYDFSLLKKKEFLDLKLDYIINCIGITKPFSRDDDPESVKRAITINSEFPWKLSEYTKKNNIKVIQIGTDCVYSGLKGLYSEIDKHDPLDVYGKSKSLGEVFDGSVLIIRCSIIGPEIKEQKSYLLEWFLNQPQRGTIGGYEHHLWNGITTLQFAQLCEKIISSNSYENLIKISYVHHYTPNNIVNKFDLMNIFNDMFQKELKINQVNKPDEIVDRTLISNYKLLNSFSDKTDIKTAIKDLKIYMDNKK